MGYLRCESCGAKALSAASQCPQCAAPFNLSGARGDRVALKTCSGCGFMHRKDRSCHWCGEIVRPTWRSPAVLKSASGIAAVAMLAVGSWVVREPALDAFTKVYAEAVSQDNQTTETALRQMPMNTPDSASTVPKALPVASATNTATLFGLDDQSVNDGATRSSMLASATLESMGPPVVRTDSIHWEPAVARTWVNVRSDASRGGDVVGVIKPDEKAMLGVDRFGWRQVRVQDVSGWVDPRLFDSDSLRTRG